MEEGKQDIEEIVENTTNGNDVVPESGVFVFAQRQANGGLTVSIRIIGDVDPLSVPTMMEHAQKVARQSVGLG